MARVSWTLFSGMSTRVSLVSLGELGLSPGACLSERSASSLSSVNGNEVEALAALGFSAASILVLVPQAQHQYREMTTLSESALEKPRGILRDAKNCVQQHQSIIPRNASHVMPRAKARYRTKSHN